MSYGVPYQGSKNLIARDIVNFLPPGGVLVDLFAGGCAVTHAALEQMSTGAPKWQRVMTNDIEPLAVGLFLGAARGLYTPETCTQWISREDFRRLKEVDGYVKFCWSFANNGEHYMYAEEIEPWKKALHMAAIQNDATLLCEILGDVPNGATKSADALFKWLDENVEEAKNRYSLWFATTWLPERAKLYGLDPDMVKHPERLDAELKRQEAEHREYLRTALKESGKRPVDIDRFLGTNGMAGHYFGASQWEFPTPEVYARLKSIMPLDRDYPWHLKTLKDMQFLSRRLLQRLQRLERLPVVSTLDYRRVKIPADAVVYCDIPYAGTNCGHYEGFDHEAFFDWACEQSVPVFVSSYEINDPRFECVWEKPKRVVAASCKYGKTALERIYRPKTN